MIYFETPRLVLRDWTEQDLKEFQAMNKDPLVMEFFPKLLSDSETEALYNRIREEILNSGFGLFAVETKHDGEFIGFVGLSKATFEAEFTPCIEIGWRLKRAAWGHGYATEAAKICLDEGLPRFGFDKVYSFTAKINLRSEHVMKKIGMKKAGEFRRSTIPADNPLCEHVLYVYEAGSK